MSQDKKRRTVFSGIQPSGGMHLGNYIGAVRNWVQDQDAHNNIFCLVDLHAITVYQEPADLRERVYEAACLLLAAGIDPERSTLFIQSHLAEHSELAWILNCVTPIGWLERMTQYKDKSKKQDSVGTGLLDYPVLQSADILLYDTDLVPVGEDQKQHIELTRDIAQRFNSLYQPTFVLPNAMVPKVGAKIMGLDDPTIKMSKSVDKPFHAVALLDEPNRILKKLKRSVTDTGREIIFSDDEAKAGVNNLLTIYQALTNQPRDAIEADFAGKGYGDLKTRVAEVVVESLAPIRERYEELQKDRGTVDSILARGAAQAREIAARVLDRVRENIGLTRVPAPPKG